MASANHPSRLYYGWIVVVACNFVAMITWGVAIFNQGVFAAHYIAVYQWPLWYISLGPVIFHIWAGAVGVAVGQLVDRYGPRYVLVSGAVLLCAALAVFGAVSQLWHYFAAFFILSTGFACIHTVTIGKIVARWFVRHRTRAMASSTIGAGIGGALLVPLNAGVIEEYGLPTAAAVLGVITLATIVPIALFVIRDGPETMGLEPDGDKAIKPSAGGSETASTDTRLWTMSAAMGTSAFWGLSICFALGMVAQSAYLFHQVPFMQARLGLVGASWVVMVTTVAGMAGRAAFIGIGDRLSPSQWMIAVFAVQASGFAILAMSDHAGALVAGSTLFGLTMGVAVTLQPLVTAYVFGRTAFGRIYGAIYFSIRMGAAAGPGLVGVGVTMSGGYPVVWIGLAATLLLAGLLVPVLIRRPA